MESELVIDEKNFSKYFREITKSMPTHGDALVCFRALAHFCDGNLKKELLNRAINDPLAEEFPFPVFFRYGINPPGNIQSLIGEIDRAGTDVSSENLLLNYKIEFNSILDPTPGLITSPNDSPNNLRQMKVNFTSEAGETDSPLVFLKLGDYFSLDFQNSTNTYRVSSIDLQNNFVELFFKYRQLLILVLG